MTQTFSFKSDIIFYLDYLSFPQISSHLNDCVYMLSCLVVRKIVNGLFPEKWNCDVTFKTIKSHHFIYVCKYN